MLNCENRFRVEKVFSHSFLYSLSIGSRREICYSCYMHIKNKLNEQWTDTKLFESYIFCFSNFSLKHLLWNACILDVKIAFCIWLYLLLKWKLTLLENMYIVMLVVGFKIKNCTKIFHLLYKRFVHRNMTWNCCT